MTFSKAFVATNGPDYAYAYRRYSGKILTSAIIHFDCTFLPLLHTRLVTITTQ